MTNLANQAAALPPGWVAQWDQQAGRHLFIESATGRSQWNPPTGGPPGPPPPPVGPGAPVAGRGFPPPTAGNRQSLSGPPAGFTPPNAGNRQSLSGPPAGFAPPGPGGRPLSGMAGPPPPPSGAPKSKRQYAADQADAYYDSAGPAPQMGGYGAAPQQDQKGPSALFSPGLGPMGGQQPGVGFYAQQQFGAVSGGAPPQQQQQQGGVGYPGQGVGNAPYYGDQNQQQGGPGGVAGLTGQFGQMGLQGRPGFSASQTLDLMHVPNEPSLLEGSPPTITLPPNACLLPNPFANADPSYQRCTVNAIPTTHSLLNKSKLPLALIITPNRSLKPGDPEVPVISDNVIARCRRCRTYINPYVTFLENGNRWKCCMCNLSNEVPQQFDWDAQTNQQIDRWQRPELSHAVVDFVAPTEYMVRAPQAPCYCFLIDVTHTAINTGMVATFARTLLESLDRIPNADERTRVCIIAVNSALNFFCIPNGSSEASMLVVSDLDDIFLPKPNDLLVRLSEAREGIEALLSKLSDMYKDTHITDNAMGAALEAASKLVSANGGKIMILTSSLPNLGPGALKRRDDPKLANTAKESSLLVAANNFYKLFPTECSKNQISIDVWLFASSYVDIASLSCLPRYTGGQTYFYPAFNAKRPQDVDRFAHEFSEVISHPIGLEAVMRVRASKGLRMSAFHGNFFVRATDLLALPAVPIDQSYAIEMQIEDPIGTPTVVFQTAVLHTTSFGERRIRVVTLALPTTQSMSELYASADQVAIATVLANKAVERVMQAKLEDARDAITNKLVDILGTFKATMGSSSGASPQLTVPENLRHLPLLLLGLLKHIGLRQSATAIPADIRAYAMALLTTLPSQMLIPYLVPHLYLLHNMPAECGVVQEDGSIPLPPVQRPSAARLERHGLHLIEDGQNMFLFVGRDAVPQLIQDVFGKPNYAEFSSLGKETLPVLDNAFSKRVNAVIGKIRSMRRSPYYPDLYVVKDDGDPSLRAWALSLLVEDRQAPLPSYQEYIGSVREKVNSGSF